MYSENSVSDAYEVTYSVDNMTDTLRRLYSSFAYYWTVGGKIAFPLSIEDTKVRKAMLEAGRALVRDIRVSSA